MEMIKLFFLVLLAFPLFVNAAPNVWSAGYAQGAMIYRLSDTQRNIIHLECAVDADELNHLLSFDSGDSIFINDENSQSLSFIFDDEITSTPSNATTTVLQAQEWNLFISNLSKAKKIDVFIDNKKYATFEPLPKNIENVASQIGEDCKPKF